MNAFSHSLGRLQSMRRRESNKKSVQPIDVDAAKQYHHAGPSSAASSSLLTPRPRHYRTSSNNSNTTSPATPAASTFASAPSSARIVSSPTFVSSSALAPANAVHAGFDALTPPLSPVHPNSAAAAQATKSPLRRALSRTFFFASGHSNAAANAQPTTPRISSPILVAADATTVRAPRPVRPARPATSPASEFSPQINAFGFAAPTMSRSQTSGPIVITPPADVATRRRSRTLMPSATLADSATDKPAASRRSISCTWSMRFSRTPSPIPITTSATSATSAPDAPSSISSPPTSLRSIRQRHARKSISSIFASSPSTVASGAHESTQPSSRSSTTDSSHLLSLRRRLVRRASEESFHCRGPGFDAPPAADTRPSMEHDSFDKPILRSCPPTAMPRSVSLNSCTHPAIPLASGARRMSDFTITSYREQANAIIGAQRHVQDILSETESEDESEQALAGLGLVSPLPATPRVLPKRLSVTSQISLTDSIPSSVPSSSSTLSLSSVENQLNSSWPDIPTMQNWFSTCPPTPPSSIRLQLEFRSLPPPSPALLSSTTNEMEEKKPRPLSGIFISSNSSVLDLKETIATRMREQGYRLSPKNLTLMLHLNEDVRSHSKTALGLKLSAYGKNPAKVLDDSSRLLFEEGAQEEDLVVVDCDPSHVLWSI